MTLLPLSLWQAFAIGLPLAIAGFAIQESILARRARPGGDPTPSPDASPDPQPTNEDRDRRPSPAPGPPPGTVSLPGPRQPERRAGPWLPGLLELESDLEDAIETTAEFVRARPRQVAAQSCAETLDRLVPTDRRGEAYAAFVRAVITHTSPSGLQELAEAVGVDLRAQLLSVRQEINPGG